MENLVVDKKVRYPLIDYLRGVAIILMVIFHGAYDLNLFGFLDINFSQDRFWYVFPRVIVTLFMLAVGSSLTLAHKNEIKWRPFWKRFFKLAVCALAITIGTYFMFPKSWVYFGTLHSIALCSLLALPFLKYPKASLFVGFALIIPHLYLGRSIPWLIMGHTSMDYIPPFPWMGVVLLGVFATHHNWHTWTPKENRFFRALKFLGLNSLFIYMIHQPLLFGAAKLLYKFTTD